MTLPVLNRRLSLEAQERIADGAGGYRTEWAELGVLWAEMVANTGRDRADSGGTIAHVGYRIIVRAAPTGAAMRPAPGQRFRDGSRAFEIRAVGEHDRHGHYLTCFADEEVAV